MRNTELSFLISRTNSKTNPNTNTNIDTGYTIRDDESPEEHIIAKEPKDSEKDKTTTTKRIPVTLYEYNIGGGDGSENYLKSDINIPYDRNTSENPYIALLKKFNNKDATYLSYSDFVYLRDIGVYPVNRLMILRRFQGAPSYDLTQHVKKPSARLNSPIATVIGWVKADEDIFNMSFHEIWKEQSKWLHDLIREIINDQFGVDIGNIFPIPGWGQSVIFGFLNKLGYTDYDSNNLPIGDANLLRTGILRETESTGIASNISLKLETTYELKYIKGVDPSVAFQGIINNLLMMGTEDIKFLFRGGSNINNLINFMESPNIGNLVVLVENMVNQIINTVMTQIQTLRSDKNITAAKTQNSKAENAAVRQNDVEKVDIAKAKSEKEPGSGTKYMYINPVDNGKYPISEDDRKEANKRVEARERAKEVEQAKSSSPKLSKTDKFMQVDTGIGTAEAVIGFVKGFVNSILASTMARYKWPVMGAIAQATGMNMTPWHLTIGNPAAPIISMNHIKVDNVDIKLSGDLLYNDLPKYIHATISISNTRPLGKQELMRIFGVKFKREHCKNVQKVMNNINIIDTTKSLEEAQSVRLSTDISIRNSLPKQG